MLETHLITKIQESFEYLVFEQTMFSKVQLQISVDDSIIYKPNDKVAGSLKIKAKKSFDLRAISLRFSGILHTTYIERIVIRDTYTQENGNVDTNTRTKYIYHEEPHHLFMETEKLNSTLNLEKFAEDEVKEYPFDFVFPLSATCRECGKFTTLPPTINRIEGDSMILSAFYSLEAEVVPDSRFSSSSRCQKFLNFQPFGNENLITVLRNSLEIPKQAVVWRSKLKRIVDERYLELYVDNYEPKDSKAISSFKSISNPLKKSHRNTRAIRGILNKSYRSEIYDKLVGNVKLEVELVLLPRLFNNSTNISETLKLFIRSRIEDMRPNFILYCGESSQLGSFIVTDFSLSITSNFSIFAHGHRGVVRRTTPLFKKNYGYELAFDLIDFFPNINDPLIREWEIPIEKLFSNEKINLSSILLGPNYSSACGALELTHTIDLQLGIASNLEETPKYSNFSCDIVLV